MARFDSRVIVVTGASRGIGRGITSAFLGEGATVVAVARDEARLAALGQELGSELLTTKAADVGDPAQARQAIADVVADHGRVDVLVNCAGVVHIEPVLEIEEHTWDETFAVNLKAPFVMSQEVARTMVRTGGGAIVNIASVDAFTAESPQAHYNSSKAALVMLTRSFAYELGHRGVRCNAVAPGFTATDMTPAGEEDAEYRSYMMRIPLRRPATPGEQAAAVLFLASDEASYVNGQTLTVDAGMLAGFWFDPAMEPALHLDQEVGDR